MVWEKVQVLGLCQVNVGNFFGFCNLCKKELLAWAFALIKSVAVRASIIQTPHTDALKPMLPNSFFRELHKVQKIGRITWII